MAIREWAELCVSFESAGPLGLFVADTEDGHVVINGPPENGYELQEDGVASQLGLRRLDRVISLNGKSMTGTDASGVRDAVQNAERPLQILLARELVAESDTPDKAAVPEEVQDKESPDETTDLVTALDRILPHGEDVCAALSLVALVGGGGKTTLVFQLARSLAHRGQRVCVTTTTKMYLPQAESNTQQMPDSIIISQHYTEASARLSAHFVEAGVGVIFLAAKTIEEPGSRTKVKGIPNEWPEQLLREGVVDALIVEADGARHLPFKAPAEHEPVLPMGSRVVLAVAGVDALGMPLDEKHVCRSDVVALITEKEMGDTVDENCMSRVMADRSVWKVPKEARFIVVINKADDSEHEHRACQVLERIDTVKERVSGPDVALVCGRAGGVDARVKHVMSYIPYDDMSYSL